MPDENTLRKLFTRNLNRLLQEHAAKQAELANFIGVSNTTINNWAKGYKMPRMDKIDKICNFFNVARSSLLDASPAPAHLPPMPAPLSKAEQSLIEKYRALDDADRDLVDNIVDTLHDRRLSKLSDKSAETLSG